jgi:competence protein ComEA
LTHPEALLPPEKLNRLWLLATGILIIIIIAGGVFILLKRPNGQALSVQLPAKPQYSGQIYIDGAVQQPGVYNYRPDDTLSSLIEASGGLQTEADPGGLQLHIASTLSPTDVQKVDINRAPLWLLEALPGIGEVKARAIIDYRQKIGRYVNIEQLTEVSGITRGVFEKIKDYITTGN